MRKRKARRKAIGPLSWSRRGPMCAGRWILSMTSSPTGSASGCSTWSMTLRANAWLRSVARMGRPSISGRRVARELTVLIERRGKPGMIVSDNGTELTSNAILRWCSEHRVEWHYVAPGKPMRDTACLASDSRQGRALCAGLNVFQLQYVGNFSWRRGKRML